MSIPRTSHIRAAFQTVVRELKASHAELNKRAAQQMERGNYERARDVMGQGEALAAYIAEVRGVGQKLRSLNGRNGEAKQRQERRAQWEYYTPVLRCLMELGGTASRPEIEREFNKSFSTWLKPGDTQLSPKGIARWQTMVGRCRKPLIAEGFIEPAQHRRWQILPAGRKAAKQAVDGEGKK